MLLAPSDWVILAAAFLGIGGLVGSGELLRQWGFESATIRRFVHMGVALFVVATPVFFSAPGPVYGLAGAFVVINTAAKIRCWWPGLHASRPESWGTVAMPLVLIPVLAVTWSVDADRLFILQASFLILALADPLASWMGELTERKEWVPGATTGGSGTFFLVSVLIATAFLGHEGWELQRTIEGGLTVAVVSTAVESLGRRGWDNLFVVLAVVSVLIPLHEGSVIGGSFVLSAVLGIGFGVGAYRAGALDARGAVAGGLFAFWLLGLGGWDWALPGFVFFVLSSLLSYQKASGAKTSEQDGRTLRQVLANGGVAWGLLVVSTFGAETSPLRPVCYAGFLGALAAAAADTWATELGVRFSARPWSLRTGARVPAGQSGAVSLGGTVAAALGAGSVAAAATFASGIPGSADWGTMAAVIGAGLSGMVVDSLAGAFLQARYRDPTTDCWIENPLGQEDRPVQGWKRIDNEVVNLLGTATGALAAVLFW